MARFRYRMQNILDVKEKLETQARNEYAQANMELLEEQEKLKALFEKQKQLEDMGKELLLSNTLSIREIENNKLSKTLLKETMRKQALVIHEAEKNVEKKQQAMIELMQERKTHEVLKQRAFEEFLLEEKAQESKEIDELTSYTYGRS